MTSMRRAIRQLALFAGALLCMAAPLQLGAAKSAAKFESHCSVARAAERRDRLETLPVSGTPEVAQSLCVASARMTEHG